MSQVRRPADAHALRRDAGIAAALGLAGALVGVLSSSAQIQEFDVPPWAAVLTSLLLALPLVWRRSHPILAATAVLLVYIPAGELGALEFTVSQVVVFLAVYSIGAWEPNRRRALVSRVVITAAMALWLLASAVRGFSAPETGEYGVQAYFSMLAVQIAINAAYFGGAWVFGDRSWQQAVEREALERAQAEVRAQQAQLTEQAITLERLRIARELHDVVAHHVSAMGIQAGAARRLLDRDPERAATALRSVETSAREAIAELGTMVGALRSQDESDAPMPTLADLPDLVRATGGQGIVTVTHEVIGDPRRLSAAVELTIYRVVQESLTNVRKHAGPYVVADVRIRYLDDAVEVEISDDGAGARGARTPGLGIGQTGMRERVAAVGGSIEMGPKSRGGYLVRALIPVAAHRDVPVLITAEETR